MNKFAKLFESDELGQILVMKEDNDEGKPSISFFIDPEQKPLGICKGSISFSDSEDGEDSRDKIFEQTNLQTAVKFCLKLKQELTGFLK